MTLFQILMLGASAFFAFKVYEHIQTLQDEEPQKDKRTPSSFDPESLVIRADEALNYYKEALEGDKDNEYIHNSIASIYRANEEFVSAKMHLNASLSINDNNPVTYYNYGNLLVDMKHFDEAKEMYKKAIEIKEDFKEAKEELEKLG